MRFVRHSDARPTTDCWSVNRAHDIDDHRSPVVVRRGFPKHAPDALRPLVLRLSPEDARALGEALIEATPDVARTDRPCPDSSLYTESERFVAGALSTLAPFDTDHPAYALPFARCALEALSEWEPSDGGGVLSG